MEFSQSEQRIFATIVEEYRKVRFSIYLLNVIVRLSKVNKTHDRPLASTRFEVLDERVRE